MKVCGLVSRQFSQLAGLSNLVSQGTRAEGAIAKLFVGKMKSYIKCVNVNYESSRIEEFNGKKQHMVLRRLETRGS